MGDNRKKSGEKPKPTKDEQSLLLPTFDKNFIEHHAGRVISDPQVAVVELVANSWDAGATEVQVTWPTNVGETVAVEDNGTGMTEQEFIRRWPALNYDRTESQGSKVEFPKGAGKRVRTAFGRNGIGRHAMFCFAGEYLVTTKKDGTLITYRVGRHSGQSPFDFKRIERKRAEGHGTKVHARVTSAVLNPESIAELIGSRFVADPDFEIYVNGQQITLTDLDHLCEKFEVPVEGVGTLIVRRYDSSVAGRTSKQYGVAFWVNKRLVGTPSWEVVQDSPLLDARTATAKRFTYVVEADALPPRSVKEDWTGFRGSPQVNAMRRAISDFVANDLQALTHDIRRERKKAALEENRRALRDLPPLSQEHVASFADEVLVKCPTIGERDLNNMVTVLAKLERARSGYSLLEKLASLKPFDMDGLEAVLNEWTISDIKRVMGELKYRLELIHKLEGVVDDVATDELHDLQPLFERGLWIFGPEFESLAFTSNLTLAKVVENFFGTAVLTTPRKRPDFVVLPDSSIGVYSCDAFDGEQAVGYDKITIVELKKGGFTVTEDEKIQAQKYANELKRSGKIQPHTKIVCHVLGSKVDPVIEQPTTDGNATIIPRAYSVLLRQAHARTFNLLRHIESKQNWRSQDSELNAVLEADGLPLFDGVPPSGERH